MKYLLGLVLIISILFWPAHPFDLSSVKVAVPPGSSVRAVQNRLIENNILPRYTTFRFMVRLLGAQNRILAGDYSFSPSDSLAKIIFKLTTGKTVPQQQISVTFPEGASIYKMGIILKEQGFANWQAVQGLVNEGISPTLRENHRKIFRYIPTESLEGYLFPDTYHFFAGASADEIAEVMIKRFEEIVWPFWEKSKKETKFSLHEIITLASIIEKEAQNAKERPLIASVFYNRLKSGMPLAADPTIKYALERPSKKVYLDQLSVKSPYNTYKRRGLPPGPICNPGIESIKAAVYPARTNYYFFVAKKDGSHIFSATWQEHQRARRTSY